MEISLEELSVKLERWKGAWPKLVRKGLNIGATILQSSIKSKWSGGVLQRRSGELIKALRKKVTLKPLRALVFVKSTQIYKASTHEAGREIFPKKKKYLVFKIGEEWKKVPSVRIPARPVFHESLQKNRSVIADRILKTIMSGYRGGK